MQINNYKKYEPFFGSWYFDGDKSKLGSGNFGSVFRVIRHDASVQPSALKIITIPKDDSEINTRRSEGMDDANIQKYYQHMVDDIKKEYELMSELKGCSNIVSCEDFMAFRHENGFGFDIVIRMELLEPLITYENKNLMDELEIMKFGIDMCRALERCEIKNIIHRDIKPDNIFISSMGDFKLGDFGIARTIESTNLAMSSRMGTPNYMAPEVYFSRTYDRTADIYSLGIVLYRMLNGKLLPFLPPQYEKKDAEIAFLRRMKGEVLPRPTHGSEALKSIVLKACAYQRQERYQYPKELREDLEMIRSILECGGTIPEEFAADLDATVAMTNADITTELEDIIIQNINGQKSSEYGNEKKKEEKSEKSQKKLLFTGLAATLTVSIFAGGLIFYKNSQKNVIENNTIAKSVYSDNLQSNSTTEENNKEDIAEQETLSQKNQENLSEEEQKEQERLSTTELKGKDITNLSDLVNYKNLEILDLAEMEIDDISFVAELKNLKELNISYTNIQDISPLKNCSNLISLNISYNNENMTEKKIMTTLSSMTWLKKLDVTGDMVVEEYKEKLGELALLTELHIGGTGISNGKFLKKCKKLKILDLQSNLMFTDFDSIISLKNLEKLNISVTGITEIAGIEKLEKLKELDISMTDISDISMLKNLKNLESITVSESSEIKKQIKVLKKTLKKCKFELV